jgi:aspartate aminotransferase
MHMLNPQIEDYLAHSSMIRRMFEAGIELRKKYGADAVCDFSLGNPDLVPPPAIIQGLRDLAIQAERPGGLGYMPNAGYPEVREKLAAYLADEQQAPLQAEHVIITCGAAGGINAFFRAVLSAGEEVICPAPYFVEYGFYAGNFGGVLKAVKSRPGDFRLDLAGLEAAINERTRVLLINSPNNPSGVIYSEEELRQLSAILSRASEKYGRPIFLLSDEPYRFLAFDGANVPAVLPLYPYSLVIGSFSKNLALAGERVGYVCCNPAMPGADKLMAALILANRILGYVNAPCIGQRLMLAALGTQADASIYYRRRQKMASVLTEAGIDFQLPAGTFYFFPKTPGNISDADFVAMLTEERILAVPGSGFGYPGYFRLALCVDERFIDQSRSGFIAAAARARAAN